MMAAIVKPASRWRTVALLLLASLIGLVILDGADRRPADSSKPLVRWFSGTDSLRDHETLRIVSFNIHSGKGDAGVDLRVTAKTLGDFDVAGLYEVRGGSLGNWNQAASLGESLYAIHSHTRSSYCGSIFAPSESQWWRDHFGNAVMSYCELGKVIRIPLPGTRGKAFRNAVLTELPWRDRTVKILSTHIDRHDDRVAQLEQVIALFLMLEPPAVLMGDLNTTIDDPQLERLREAPGVRSPLHDALGDKVPADNIDWMFTRGLKTVTAELVENAASDHPVLRAELAIEKTSEERGA